MATGNLYRWKPVNVQNKIREIFHFTDTVTHLIQSWRKLYFNRDNSALALTGVDMSGYCAVWPSSLCCCRSHCPALLLRSLSTVYWFPHRTPPASRTPQRGINSGLITRFESRDVHCWGILLSDIKEWLTSTTQTMRRGIYLLFSDQKFAGSNPMYRTQNILCTGNNSETSDVRMESFHECQDKNIS
jgi:hypothetical protein